jgi:ribose 5-phosphate isomerase B
MSKVVVAIASDHAGVELKAFVKGELEGLGFAVSDLGTQGTNSVDYPDFADAVAAALAEKKASQGVLICGTGIGISMAANRHRHVRAALCHDATSARLSRQHNDANVLALGARLIGPEAARDCVRMFFSTAFEGGRHQRRLDKLS